MFLKLAIRAQQMFEDLSQLINDTIRKITLEILMNMITEMMKINKTDQQEINEMKLQMDTAESHHTKISTDMYDDAHSNMTIDGHINYTKDVVEVDEEIEHSYTNMYIDGYVNDAQYEYKVVPTDDDMSTNDHFQNQVVRIIQWRNQVQLKKQQYWKMHLKYLLL